jgi:hypothetical protein
LTYYTSYFTGIKCAFVAAGECVQRIKETVLETSRSLGRTSKQFTPISALLDTPRLTLGLDILFHSILWPPQSLTARQHSSPLSGLPRSLWTVFSIIDTPPPQTVSGRFGVIRSADNSRSVQISVCHDINPPEFTKDMSLDPPKQFHLNHTFRCASLRSANKPKPGYADLMTLDPMSPADLMTAGLMTLFDKMTTNPLDSFIHPLAGHTLTVSRHTFLFPDCLPFSGRSRSLHKSRRWYRPPTNLVHPRFQIKKMLILLYRKKMSNLLYFLKHSKKGKYFTKLPRF